MHPRDLRIADYTYELPEERIAQRPLEERDASRLLVCRDGAISDRTFHELPGLLPPDALLVLNDTQVVNARLLFQRETGARIEVLCLAPADGVPVEEAFATRGQCVWDALVGNAKKWRTGEELHLRGTSSLGAPLSLRASREGEGVCFAWEPSELSFSEVLDRLGHVPLPPYMSRPDEDADRTRYNTVFARHPGSVAAPTASLHVSPGVLEGLGAKGIARTTLTLHVGAGTFAPVKSERMAEHPMHGEQVSIPREALLALAERLGRGPIIPVGTTALRTLESIYWHGVMILEGRAAAHMDIDQWEPYELRPGDLPTPARSLEAVITQVEAAGEVRLVGSTRLLIAPGYTFRFADALVTNFHQPQSTLLLLVAAFLGTGWRAVYDHALRSGYRFLSYGDGSLLWRRVGAVQ